MSEYTSEMRKASDVKIDDHLTLGENGLLYCVLEIESFTDETLDFVGLKLALADEADKITVGALVVQPTEWLMIYNKK